MDSPDNYEARYIIEDACTKNKKIIVHASVFRFQGQVTIFTPDTACYRCLFPEIPDNEMVSVNSGNGIFGPLTGIIGTIQAIETIKIITGIGKSLKNNLLCYNSLDNSVGSFKLEKDPLCSVCS